MGKKSTDTLHLEKELVGESRVRTCSWRDQLASASGVFLLNLFVLSRHTKMGFREKRRTARSMKELLRTDDWCVVFDIGCLVSILSC